MNTPYCFLLLNVIAMFFGLYYVISSWQLTSVSLTLYYRNVTPMESLGNCLYCKIDYIKTFAYTVCITLWNVGCIENLKACFPIKNVYPYLQCKILNRVYYVVPNYWGAVNLRGSIILPESNKLNHSAKTAEIIHDDHCTVLSCR